MNTQHVNAIVTEARVAGPETLFCLKGGWSSDIELALLDAVLSIQAQYETKNGKGVLPNVKAYRTPNGDLHELAGRDEAELLTTVCHQRTGRRTKASAAIEAAANLVQIGVQHAADFQADSLEQRRAYTRVTGLGPVTYSYLRMLLGHPDVKADIWVNRFVHRVTGDATLTPQQIRELVTAAASTLNGVISPTVLDHAIWRSEAQSQATTDGKVSLPDADIHQYVEGAAPSRRCLGFDSLRGRSVSVVPRRNVTRVLQLAIQFVACSRGTFCMWARQLTCGHGQNTNGCPPLDPP